jgi:hypothetical protein
VLAVSRLRQLFFDAGQLCGKLLVDRAKSRLNAAGAALDLRIRHHAGPSFAGQFGR